MLEEFDPSAIENEGLRQKVLVPHGMRNELVASKR
jgi:hypothetical protein